MGLAESSAGGGTQGPSNDQRGYKRSITMSKNMLPYEHVTALVRLPVSYVPRPQNMDTELLCIGKHLDRESCVLN